MVFLVNQGHPLKYFPFAMLLKLFSKYKYDMCEISSIICLCMWLNYYIYFYVYFMTWWANVDLKCVSIIFG